MQCLTITMSPPHVSCSRIYIRKRAFGSPIATVYKTNPILNILTFSTTIRQRHADRTWRSRPYIRGWKRTRAKSVLGHIFFLILHGFCRWRRKKTAVAKRLLQSDTIKKQCFFIAEDACDALTMENVTYSDFMKIMKNENVLRTHTRSIFAYTQNSSGFTIHYLVCASGMCMCKSAWEPHQTMYSPLYACEASAASSANTLKTQ